MSVARKWIWSWLPCGALLAAAGCSQFPGGMNFSRDDASTQISAARMHESRGQADQARALYEKALAKDANSGEAHHRLALLNARERKYGDAEKHFLAALRAQPNDSKILADYGYMEYCQERLLEAERTTRKALDGDPKNPRVINNLALIVGRQARYQESLVLFRQAGTEAQAHANIAWIYAQNGETDLAAQAYAKAIALDGNNRAASIAYAQLCEGGQPGAEESEPSETIERQELPPALQKKKPNSKIARKSPFAPRTVSRPVQTANLDAGPAESDLQYDLPERAEPAPAVLKTAANVTPRARSVVAHQPPAVDPKPIADSKSAIDPKPASPKPGQPSIRSRQMAERGEQPELTPPKIVPAKILPDLDNPLAPESTPVAESGPSWADSISRKIAETSTSEPSPAPAETTAEVPAKPAAEVVAKPAAKPPTPVITRPDGPFGYESSEPAKPGLIVPVLPRNEKPSKALKVVEPLEIKPAKPAKIAEGFKSPEKSADKRKTVAQPAKQTKNVASSEESLPDLPGASADKPSEKPAANSSNAKSSTGSKKDQAVAKSTKSSDSKSANKPHIRRLSVRSLFGGTPKTTAEADTKKSDARKGDKPVVRRLAVNPIPAVDPLATKGNETPAIRQAAAQKLDLPFLSEHEPEPLPFLKAEDELDTRAELPPLPNLNKSAGADNKVPAGASLKSQPGEPKLLVAPPVPPNPVPKALPTPVTQAKPLPESKAKPVPQTTSLPKSSDDVFPLGDFPTTPEPTEKDILQLAELLNKGSAVEREAAAIALGELGAAAKAAVPSLVEALVDSNDSIRRAAANALEKIEATATVGEIQQSSGTTPVKGRR